ncbi:hypothetical protein SHIRM173S_03982 [Streptomyces hirsutus]
MLRRERGITVSFTTHQLEEAEHRDRIAIFDHGKLITQGSPAELKSIIGAGIIMLRTEDDRRAVDALSDRFGLPAELTPTACACGSGTAPPAPHWG